MIPDNKRTSSAVMIIGAGFTGLTAAYELSRRGVAVTVLESAPAVGGLASAFVPEARGSEPLDCFYRHLFNNDQAALDLIEELRLGSRLIRVNSKTGIFHEGRLYSLSTPLDLLKFSPLAFWDRIRMGLLTLRVRGIKDYLPLEKITASDWLLKQAGPAVFHTVWEPLLRGKFGEYASEVNAVWFWNKLKLRGGSRKASGAEELIYLKGTFQSLARTLQRRIEEAGGRVLTSHKVEQISREIDGEYAVYCNSGESRAIYRSPVLLNTVALPVFADLISYWADPAYLEKLRQVKYLGNLCLSMELHHEFSQLYWMNVADPSFPFVGVIEHTNFVPAKFYGGSHIVYLSKYLSKDHPLYAKSAEEFFDYALPYLKRIKPDFSKAEVRALHLFRAPYSQHIATLDYSKQISACTPPYPHLYLSTFAQIYPEDRGVSYAIDAGQKVAARILDTDSNL